MSKIQSGDLFIGDEGAWLVLKSKKDGVWEVMILGKNRIRGVPSGDIVDWYAATHSGTQYTYAGNIIHDVDFSKFK